MSRVRVDVPGSAYEVHVAAGLLPEIGRLVRTAVAGATVALVSDESVGAIYAGKVDISLAQSGFRVVNLTVPPGETSKNWSLAGQLVEELASAGLGRQDAVVALGGGVVGDLAGFAAAVYQRGIGFVQVPTTLLAMVDSSVGGKTAVDLVGGKNLAGAFKQPAVVVADTDTLSTLPASEWGSGMAEVAKSAVLDSEEFTSWLERSAALLVGRDETVVRETVERCIRFKARVVAGDEREAGDRECLNYGHTLGHALEKVLGYGALTHGAAVAEGMRFAARVGIELGGASPEYARRVDRLLLALGIEPLQEAPEPGVVLEAMHSDKKVRSGTVRMVLVKQPGEWSCVPVADATIREHLEAWAESKRGA